MHARRAGFSPSDGDPTHDRGNGEGRGRIVCTGNSQHWEVHAATQGKATFDEGPAVAVAIARTADHGDITDAHQWLVNITLVDE